MRIMQYQNKILLGDALTILRKLPNESIDCVMTSPPYWALRDYEVTGQIGVEPGFQEYIEKLCRIFDEIKRVLKPTGTCWVNMGDTYGTGSGSGVRTGKQATNRGTQYNRGWQEKGKAGVKGMGKCLLQIPNRFAISMCERGWILRNEVIWHKPNAMPQSVKDRFTVDFEKLFFFVKSQSYRFETQFEPYTKPLNRWGGTRLIANGTSEWDKGTGQKNYRSRNMRPNDAGRNKRCVWSINTHPQKDSHFATFPPALVEIPIKAGCLEGGVVLDPFIGSGTTAVVARSLGRIYIGIDLNPAYVAIAKKRLGRASGRTSNGALAVDTSPEVDRRSRKDKEKLKKK